MTKGSTTYGYKKASAETHKTPTLLVELKSRLKTLAVTRAQVMEIIIFASSSVSGATLSVQGARYGFLHSWCFSFRYRRQMVKTARARNTTKIAFRATAWTATCTDIAPILTSNALRVITANDIQNIESPV